MNKKVSTLEYKCYFNTPIGLLLITASQSELISISFVEDQCLDESVNALLEKAKCQLHEYFNGNRLRFTLPLKYAGTDFQVKVWKALETIGYGETVAYKTVAEKIKNPKAYRAVGNANNKNQLPIIIPCHRVISSVGGLTGYAGGIWRKKWLLSHEEKTMRRLQND